MNTRTVIVGGGLAGLAAAVALADRGVGVTVLESRPRLGGRASSFLDPSSGEWIDNCQHVALGCCTNFLAFCRTVGIDALFRSEPELYFLDREGQLSTLRESALPAPLHLLSSFARMKSLSAGERLRIALGLRSLARNREAAAGGNFLDWCRSHSQSDVAIERFWTPVLVSALSESLDRIAVPHARKVFVDSFLRNKAGWQVLIPTVPLDALYGGKLTAWFAARGVTVRLQAGVERIAMEGPRAVACLLRGGERVEGDQFILAVPHHRVLDVAPPALSDYLAASGVERLESAPISSVHLWFDQPVLFRPGSGRGELPHCVLLERFSQWVFNRSLLQHSSGDPDRRGHTYQVVISASRNVQAMPQAEAIEEVLRDFRALWPASAEATLLHARVVTEHRAVFSVTPGSDACRPPQRTPIENLHLAGDWTRTGWPATMEGAVRSGHLAAESALEQLGRPERLLSSDLPTSALSRWLLRLP